MYFLNYILISLCTEPTVDIAATFLDRQDKIAEFVKHSFKLGISDSSKNVPISPNLHDAQKKVFESTAALSIASSPAPVAPVTIVDEIPHANEQFLRAMLAFKTWIVLVKIFRIVYGVKQSGRLQGKYVHAKLILSERKFWNVIWPLLREKLFQSVEDPSKFDVAAWSSFVDLVIFLFETGSELTYLYSAEISLAMDAHQSMVIVIRICEHLIHVAYETSANRSQVTDGQRLHQGPTHAPERGRTQADSISRSS